MLDRNKYTMQEIAAMIGRTSRYVSMWIILRPSLGIKYKREKKGKARHNIFDRENAEKFLKAYTFKEFYHQEFDMNKVCSGNAVRKQDYNADFTGDLPDGWFDLD